MFERNRNGMSRRGNQRRRRAAVAVYMLISMSVVVGFAALAVDVGMLYNTQAELQRTADAAALASAWELLDEDRLKGGSYLDYVLDESRASAVTTAAGNPILRAAPVVDPSEDVLIGYLANPYDGTGALDISNLSQSNAVSVAVQRNASRGGSVTLYFARFLGADSKDMYASATAAFADNIVGFEVAGGSGDNVKLLPFALHVDIWNALIAGSGGIGDNYGYDKRSGSVYAAGDDLAELNLYPGSGGTQLPPGNFGTVDIGSNNNSTKDIARQILYGVSEADLSYFGGKLTLDDGPLYLNGDTGLSAGIKDELEAIKGQARAIPLFDSVCGPGNNAEYHIVGFAGIRIMDVKLTGSMRSKHVIIQPGMVVDKTAVPGAGAGPSSYVYRPVQLVR